MNYLLFSPTLNRIAFNLCFSMNSEFVKMNKNLKLKRHQFYRFFLLKIIKSTLYSEDKKQLLNYYELKHRITQSFSKIYFYFKNLLK
jgi:hypothetical protein